MKRKCNLILIVLILVCLICFSSCDENPVEEVNYTVTEEQWTEVLKRELPADNVTITYTSSIGTVITEGVGTFIIKLNLDKKIAAITLIYNGQPMTEGIMYIENGKCYELGRYLTAENPKWEKREINGKPELESLKMLVLTYYRSSIINALKDSYSDFQYNADTLEYNAENLSINVNYGFASEQLTVPQAVLKFVDGELACIRFDFESDLDIFAVEYSNYGTTDITLPTNYIESK